MAEVRPFGGLRFTGVPLDAIIAPPFDVISPAEQARLYDRSPYNVVRLELGREDDRYDEAQRCYRSWRSEGVLRQDEPCLYLYEQHFGRHVRRGLIARVKLEPWSAGVVLPHEATHTQAKADRLALMRAVKANVSPVFSLYEDPEQRLTELLASVSQRAPEAEATDDAGEQHRLWRLAGESPAAEIAAFFSGKQLFIADGHHRYETALAYRDEVRQRAAPGGQGRADSAAEFVMMVLVDFADPGLVVLPTHRLLANLSNAQQRQLNEQLGAYFEVIAAADDPSPQALAEAMQQAAAAGAPAFVLYGPLPSGLRVLELKPEWRGKMLDVRRSPAWNGLDVAVIHGAFERILELTPEDLAGQRYFRYEQEPQAAMRKVQRGEAQLALLLRPTPATAVRDIALAGDKMPQKATYFYPKLATGMVINPLD